MDSFSGISIVICTHNGSKRLLPTLKALTLLEADFPWEILVINNASTDDTDDLVHQFFNTQPERFNWKIIEEPKPGLIHARLKGLASTSYPYVLFCDDDNWLFPDYLTKAAILLSGNPDIGALGGQGIAVFEGEKPDWFDKYHSSFGVGTQAGHIGVINRKLGYLYGAGVIFKKSLFVELFNSGFQPVLTGRKGTTLISGDDVELCYLVQLKGYKLQYNENLKFNHWMAESRMSWNYYLTLKEAITKGSSLLYSYEFFFKHPTRNSLEIGLELLKQYFIYILIYWKNLLYFSMENNPKDLSIRILKSKKESFFHDFFRSISHYKNLKKYF